jgi:hypothetical protein
MRTVILSLTLLVSVGIAPMAAGAGGPALHQGSVKSPWGSWGAQPDPPSVFGTPPDPWRHWGLPKKHHGHRPVVVAPPRAVWVQPHWAWDGVQWVLVPGHWRTW